MIPMHSASVLVFERALNNMLAWLDKAEAYAKARGFDAQNYLELRLAPDMLPFSRQIQIASDSAKGCVARLADVEAPKWEDNEVTMADLRARIEKTIAFVKSVPVAKLDGSTDREISLPLPSGAIEFTGESFVRSFVLPNFFFHCTMTYALLRHAGVELGKMDYLGAP